MTMMEVINANTFGYYEDKSCIMDIFSSYAMEADVPDTENEDVTSVDDASNKRKATKTMLERVKKLIETIKGFIERIALKVKNVLRKIAQQDAGFRRNCNEAFVKNKPLQGVKLIAYEYNPSALESEISKLTNVVSKRIADVNTHFEDGAKQTKEDDIITGILKDIGLSDEKNLNVNTYFLHLKDVYRSNKSEQLFVSSNRNEYYKIALSGQEIGQSMNTYQKKIENLAEGMKAKLNGIANNNDATDEIKRKALEAYGAVSHIFSFYTRVMDVYFQLRIEQMYSYRAVLKKLYHFT